MTDTSVSPLSAITTLDAYRRMYVIRSFEQRCLALGADTIAGSMHFCGGQEAIPVGARAALREDDRVVATYRGHGWAIEWGIPLEELLGEVAHRAGGVNGGRAGSPYLMDPERGFIGENSIVGAGIPIGAGVAMAAQAAGNERVCVVSVGDGAMNQGATHEGINFAAVRDLPVIFVVENNAWSEMTPIALTARVENLAERAAGYGIPGVTIDGNDPFAVAAAVTEAAERARAGGGPTLIEAKTVRLMAHYNRDIEHYRTEGDKELSRALDPLPKLRARLLAEGVGEAEITALEGAAEAELDHVIARVLAMPEPDPATARDHVMALPGRATPAREGAETRTMPYWRGVNEALRAELAARPETLLYGEDVGHAGGIFGATRQLQKEFGAHRVFDTPISESAILGSAVGAAIEGIRPVVEIMWADFLFVALDQLVNQAANIRYISRGTRSVPIVVRTQQGATPGSCAQHSQCVEALLAHIPGLRVGLPAHADDAYSMLRAAINDPDPTVIIEARGLYNTKGEVRPLDQAPPIGGAAWRCRGGDVAIISWGAMSRTAEDAAAELAREGVEATVLDLRWLNPLDEEAIAEAVATAGGRVVVAHEAPVTGGFGAEIAARIAERHAGLLTAPVVRVGARDVPMPASPALQAAVLPHAGTIIEAARRLARG
ncbi:alpha-ketoacid dehydrogenase subunit alpha/beta [Nonomuraea antimicrobica]|uniref:dihydrolipoyllysine-residue succinyltransferase n=1 Tax=Nonomuraea antimicrobica TaxID=561173 RepID=A0ABP7DBC7_9ACTN